MDLLSIVENDDFLKQFFNKVKYDGFESCKLKKISDKKHIVKSGDEYDDLKLIISGRLNVFFENESGKSYIVERIGEYRLIGEMELIADEDRIINNVITVTECEYISIPKKIYFKWFLNYHEFALDVAKRLGEMICSVSKTNGLNIIYNSEMKLAFYLEKRFLNSGSKQIKLLETRDTLSEIIGVSVRTINRVISKFVKSDILTLINGKIFIDKSRFEKLKSFIDKNL